MAYWNSRSEKFHSFFINCCKEFKTVLYVFGNHEYYHGDFNTELDSVREKLSYLPNLHILEKDLITIDDVTFLGATLWTDMNNNDPIVKWDINKGMNDFHIIKNSSRMVGGYKPGRFLTEDSYEDHLKAMIFLLEHMDKEKIVVVTHHTPSIICSLPEFRSDPLTFAYYSSLEDFIETNPNIKAWICGHSHNVIDEVIGETRLLMNCRGYANHEPIANSFKLKYFEVL